MIFVYREISEEKKSQVLLLWFKLKSYLLLSILLLIPMSGLVPLGSVDPLLMLAKVLKEKKKIGNK